MGTQLTILEFDARRSKNGTPYLALVTDKGKMSCWDSAPVELIQHHNVPLKILADLEEKSGYTNIVHAELVKHEPKNLDEKQVSVIMSYVKDMVCAGKVPLDNYEETCAQFLEVYKRLIK